jgi:poly-gamma-glutamate capsule biosynthesis protein CapA/YwtB (metallophosphatase superfamily)
MKKIFLFVILLSLDCLAQQHFDPNVRIKIPTLRNPDSILTVRIAAVGDMMCHSPQFKYSQVSKDSFDFVPVFRYINKYLRDADFTLGNLETITAGKNKKYSGYPLFNSPDEFISAVKNAGFNLVTTSNNHALDRGEPGINKTISQLIKNNLNYTGTYNSQQDRDSIRIFDIKGIKTAFLSYSYGTNGNPIPRGKKYLINIIDYDLIQKDITHSRQLGAELVIVYFHFGDEYKREPSAFQKNTVNKTKEMGADIILGGHPHMLEPAIYYKTHNAKLDTGFAVYSLGNFLSNQRKRYTDGGTILYLNITKNINTDSLWISSVEFLPTWIYRGTTDHGREYLILPAKNEQDYPFLHESDKRQMQTSFEDTRYILHKYTSQIHSVK